MEPSARRNINRQKSQLSLSFCEWVVFENQPIQNDCSFFNAISSNFEEVFAAIDILHMLALGNRSNHRESDVL